MKIKLVNYTPDPEKAIELAYLACRNLDPWNPKRDIPLEDRINSMWEIGHISPFEFADATFYITGVSRSCSHQFVRHRLASYAQLSMRHVHIKDLFVQVPTSIATTKFFNKFCDIVGIINSFYEEMVNSKVPKQDARFIVPIGIETRFMVKMNLRSWLHFLRLRTHTSAQWEIREVADEIHKLLKEISPNVFSDKHKDCWKYV